MFCHENDYICALLTPLQADILKHIIYANHIDRWGTAQFYENSAHY